MLYVAPDRQLRNQARLQNFTSANEVVRAFRSITLPKRLVAKQYTGERLRCYNCNCSEHYAKDCRKPKRYAGKCYACGQQGHYAMECKMYKKEKNNFVSYFRLYVFAHINTYIFIECLVDSGSPVSLLKQVVVPPGVELEEVNETYYGLNKTVLCVIGKMKCILKVLNKEVLIEFLVVPNGCIGYTTLLGRDFIEASHARLKIGNAEFLDRVAQIETVSSVNKVEEKYETEKIVKQEGVNKVENNNKVETTYKVKEMVKLHITKKGSCDRRHHSILNITKNGRV
ncbi:PREDICTED: uncharacterized protein LOC108363404 [Rhagoletis zephyria]|uniref:uncharacterized protein LOC108363404 n=1 Tax=Rhagoletis zephyria TaxID=28612 RepID=UPI0008119415|nr:PREDICTED: uncharacterized protein LOC108363404 [Rhagoletis zephyria]